MVLSVAPPHLPCVASSPCRWTSSSTETTQLYCSLIRFKDIVRLRVLFADDGKMLYQEDEKGQCQLFDMGSRTVMRTFAGHSKAVHVAKFANDGARLFTASDDGRAVCWDVQAERRSVRSRGTPTSAAAPSRVVAAPVRDRLVRPHSQGRKRCDA